ncbi:hypothetical protein Tco_0110965 [Tanacetum coccineum]
MAEIGCNWARIGSSKSSQSLSNAHKWAGLTSVINYIPESRNFRFNLEEISSGSPTTHSELSLPDYKAFYIDNDHFKEKSSGSTTTHVDFSQYDSFIFDLSNDQFPPADRSDFYHEEFADELAHIMAYPELDVSNLKIEPNPGRIDFIDHGLDFPDYEDSHLQGFTSLLHFGNPVSKLMTNVYLCAHFINALDLCGTPLKHRGRC